MADEKNLPPQARADLDAMEARHARRRRRDEAALDVPETWEDFVPDVRHALASLEAADAAGGTAGLGAARLWFHLRRIGGDRYPFTLEEAVGEGYLLDLNAEDVGRALDALRRAELVSGTAEGFVAVHPGLPF